MEEQMEDFLKRIAEEPPITDYAERLEAIKSYAVDEGQMTAEEYEEFLEESRAKNKQK